MNQIELMTVENFPERTIIAAALNQPNDTAIQQDKSPMIVQFKKDNEANRSKIGSFLQLVNNAASGLANNRDVQLSAIGSNIPMRLGS
jgi:hypothetical protein